MILHVIRNTWTETISPHSSAHSSESGPNPVNSSQPEMPNFIWYSWPERCWFGEGPSPLTHNLLSCMSHTGQTGSTPPHVPLLCPVFLLNSIHQHVMWHVCHQAPPSSFTSTHLTLHLHDIKPAISCIFWMIYHIFILVKYFRFSERC